MKFELPPLPFADTALEPVISAKTLSFHHGKHHKAYVDKLNELVPGTEFENADLETIIKKATGPIFNNGAQVWNHTFYWECLGGKGGAPTGNLLKAIEETFGSFDEFKTKFAEAATTQFGSGWAWLVDDGGKLKVTKTANAENPMRDGMKPILTCDVWEHAYYLDYQNRRPDYVKSFWDIVDWNKVANNFGS